MTITKENYFDLPVVEVIKKRRSCRSFTGQKISEEQKNKITEYFSNLKGPFNIPVRFELIDNLKMDNNGAKIGTYGVIKGTNTYIAAAVGKGEMSMVELGYVFEKLILYATSLNLGTCWLGGTFNRGEFSKAIKLKEDEILPIVSPIGNISDNRRLVDLLLRRTAGSDNRLDWEKLFFNDDAKTFLKREDAGKYEIVLDMLRIAPSASNKQPWRIIKNNGYYHFYLQKTAGYGKVLGYDIQKVDMGIAMCHFELTATEAGLNGKWETLENMSGKLPTEMEYITSWTVQ